MSVINQMLRDLDQQRGPANGAHIAALRDLGLVVPNNAPRWRTGSSLAWVFAVIASFVLIPWVLSISTGTAVTNGLAAQTRQSLVLPPEQTRRLETRRTALAPVAAPTIEGDLRDIPDKVTTKAIAAVEALPVQKQVVAAVAPPAATPVKVVALTAEEKADRLFKQAQTALTRRDDGNAAKLLEQSLAEYPEHNAAREQLAMLMIRDGQQQNAETLLAEGLVVTPWRADLARAYAQLLVERGALLPALQTLERFSEDPSTDAAMLALQAGILDRLQRYAEAADVYRRALRLQPRQAVWWTGLGVALEHQGQPAMALDAYRRAVQLPLQDAVRTFVQQRIQALDGPWNRANG